MGEGARRFVDWLAASGVSLWQVLPLVPPGAGSSPYSSHSALSGNPWLLDPGGLAADGLLRQEELSDAALSDAAGSRQPLSPGACCPDAVDHRAVRELKGRLLGLAARRLLAGSNAELLAALSDFREAEPWVEEAALFTALHRRFSMRPWWSWPEELRDRRPAALEAARRELREEIDREVALQLLFDRQWRALREHCRGRGVRLLGDVPIYVARDSVDVWAHREMFLLERDGTPRVVAGVPPDYFSDLGQLWGNPIYDWRRMAQDGWTWWRQRLRRALDQTDLVRLDHFRGFSAYWEIPAQAPDARQGRWVEGPGMELFSAMEAALGELPLVAEDLGEIDQPVHDLRDALGLPGMKVLHFAFGAQSDHPFLPHTYPKNCVAYTGTHDNNTTLGWWQGLAEPARDHVRRYLGVDGHDVVWDLIRLCLSSVAHTAVIPMQDLLVLDHRSRMNTPGEADGNWAWRVRAEAFNHELGGRLLDLCRLYGRAE